MAGLEVLYRIYEVVQKRRKPITEVDKTLDLIGIFSYDTYMDADLIAEDVLICDDRDSFKQSMRMRYGDGLAFRHMRGAQAGSLYCIIVGEHCWNLQRRFNRIEFVCDCCGTTVRSFIDSAVRLTDYEIKSHFGGNFEMAKKRFCSERCKDIYSRTDAQYGTGIEPINLYVTKDSFPSVSDKAGFIYRITNRKTGEFYIGKSNYVPVFRWGQHLRTERFRVDNIVDYVFETLEVVPQGHNILEAEARQIKLHVKQYPDRCLNVVHNKAFGKDGIQLELETEENK